MLILASASSRRKQILSLLVKDFKIIPTKIDEEKFVPLARTPEELVTKLAFAKARRVVTGRDLSLQNNIIISADTIVVLPRGSNFQIIGKPKDKQDAQLILKSLRGKTHQVYTGICVLDQNTNQIATDHSRADVTFKLFSDKLLNDYIDKFHPYDKAGAYAIQEMGEKYVKSYTGSLSGIIGLPIENLVPILKKFSVKLKSNWQERIKKQIAFK